MELEAYKAELACEILTTDSRQVLDEVKRLLTKLSKKTKKKVLWDIIKGTNVCLMGLSERAEKDKESESLLNKKMTANPQI